MLLMMAGPGPRPPLAAGGHMPVLVHVFYIADSTESQRNGPAMNEAKLKHALEPEDRAAED